MSTGGSGLVTVFIAKKYGLTFCAARCTVKNVMTRFHSDFPATAATQPQGNRSPEMGSQ
jgi:hypothetical protein